jgi:hypothetical protein
MANKTRAELITSLNDNVLTGGRRTTALKLRDFENAVIESMVNKVDDLNVINGYLGISAEGIVDISFIKKTTPTGQFLKDDGTWSTISGGSLTLAQVLTNGNIMPGVSIIQSDNGTAKIIVSDGGASFLYDDGVSSAQTSASTSDGAALYGTDGTEEGEVKIKGVKNTFNHTVLNEFNAPNNDFNGRLTVVSGIDNDAIVLKGDDTLLKAILYNSDNNSGLLSLRNEVATETIRLDGFTGSITKNGIEVFTFGGGTLTGTLILNADASVNLGAVTLQQLIAYTNGLYDLRGGYDASVNLFPTTGGSGTAGVVNKADVYIVTVAGTLGGVAVTPGDEITALVDLPGQTSSNWNIVSHDLGYTPITNVLNSAKILVGNASNLADAVDMTGDMTISNTGVTAIGAGKVTNAMLAGSISYNKLSAMTSAELASIVSDETGTGVLVYSTSPTLVTPILGVASATSLGITGTAGAGFVDLTNQSSDPSAPSSGINRIFADTIGKLSKTMANGTKSTYRGKIYSDISNSSTVTGTTSNTIFKSALVEGGSYSTGGTDTCVIEVLGGKTNVNGTHTQRLYANTSVSLSGAVLLGTQDGLATTTFFSMQRNLRILSASSTQFLSDNFSGSGDMPANLAAGTGNGGVSTTSAIDWSADLYIFHAIQPASASDIFVSRQLKIYRD